MSAREASRDVVLGVVGRPWGVKGQFLLDPLGTEPGLLLGRGRLRLRRQDGSVEERRLLGSHVAGGKLVVRLEGCDTIEEAAAWRGSEVILAAEAFDPPPAGSYYPHELIGCEVSSSDGRAIGRVEEVLRTGGAELLVIRSAGREHLVPFAREICRRVDPEARRIEIDPPEGLLDLDEPGVGRDAI